MKKALLVVVAFFVVSITLTWIWNEWLRADYARLLNAVAPPIYELIGFGDARVGAHRLRYTNFVPFVSLVLVTPGIAWRRRATGLVLGLMAIFVSHLGLNLTERIAPGQALPMVPALLSDALPFLLWLVVARPTLVGLLPSGAPPVEGDAGT